MSTDRPIPERWKPAADKAKDAVRDGYGQKVAICWDVYLALIVELGTAESLVRDLARWFDAIRNAKNLHAAELHAEQALSHIPKELQP